MSGKEAMVYVVRCGDEMRCAKGVQGATQRAFRQAWTTPRIAKVKNTRQRAPWPRAPASAGSAGAAWQSAEVDALYRWLRPACACPAPYFCDGVLLMELVTDENGEAGPRGCTTCLDPEQARVHHGTLLMEVVRMLWAGVVHADLSDSTSCWGRTAPSSSICRRRWTRPATTSLSHCCCALSPTCRSFFGRFRAELLHTDLRQEIWDCITAGALHPEVVLTPFERSSRRWTWVAVMREIEMHAWRRRRAFCACSLVGKR